MGSLLKQKWFQNSLALFIAAGAALLYLHPYWEALRGDWNQYIVLCGDFGLYLGEAQKYATEGANLVETVNVNHEPALYLAMSTLERISGIRLEITLIVIGFCAHILTILGIYIGVLRGTKNRTIAIGAILLISTLYLYNTTFTYLTTRQNLSNLYLILCSILPLIGERKRNRTYIVGGILMACAIIAHRVGLLFSGLALGISLIYALIKKDWKTIKNLFIMISILIIAAGPYLALDFNNTLYTIKWYYNRMLGVEDLVEEGLSFSNGEDSISGWSFFARSQTITELPIIHYFTYQPFIVILGISLLGAIKGKKFINDKNYLFLSFILALTVYVFTHLIFGVRVLGTFEIFFILFISILIKKDSARLKITMIILIAFLGLLNLIPRSIILSRVYNTSNDEGINFIKKNIKTENTYLVGPYCVADLGVQLGYTTSHTLTNSPVWGHKEKEQNGELHSFIVGNITNTLMHSIGEKPYLHELLRGKELYIIYLPSANKDDVALFRKKEHPYLSSPFVSMEYKDKNQKSYIGYIVKINNDKITYFDSVNYLLKTLR